MLPRSFASWEDIPQDRLETRQEGLSMAEKLLRQDRQPVWAASQNFADVQKRLKLQVPFKRPTAAVQVRLPVGAHRIPGHNHR